MLSKTFPALALSVLLLQPVTAAAVAGPGQSAPSQTGEASGLDVAGIRARDNQVTAVAAVQAMPGQLAPSAFTVTAAAAPVPSDVTPVLSDQVPVEIVIDASMAGTVSPNGGGVSGAAGLLLQLPAGAVSGVIADHSPPQVLEQPSAGVSDDLQALSELRATGAPATSEALAAALGQLPAGGGVRSLIVLYTAQPDAGTWPARTLIERMQAANAVLAVVTTSASAFWPEVTQATGGVSIFTDPSKQIPASDQMADDLHARYWVTFSPPAGAEQATLAVTTSDGAAEALFQLPPRAQPGPAASASSAWRWIAALAILALLLVVAGIAAIVVRRRSHMQSAEEVQVASTEMVWRRLIEESTAREPEPVAEEPEPEPVAEEPEPEPEPVAEEPEPVAEEPEPVAAEPEPVQPKPVRKRPGLAWLTAPEPAQDERETAEPAAAQTSDETSNGEVRPLPGIRVFDVTSSEAPLDITNSLFEPRQVRDAREREEAAEAAAEEAERRRGRFGGRRGR